METKRSCRTQKNETPNRRTSRRSQKIYPSLNESAIFDINCEIMYNAYQTPKKLKSIQKEAKEEETTPSCSPSKKSRTLKETSKTPKAVTFESEGRSLRSRSVSVEISDSPKVTRRQSQSQTPSRETPRTFNSARESARARSMSRTDFSATSEPKTPKSSVSVTRVCQSARITYRSSSIFKDDSATCEQTNSKRSSREVRNSNSSDDEIFTRSTSLTNNKTLTIGSPLTDESSTLTHRTTRQRSRKNYEERDVSPVKTPRKKPLMDNTDNTGLTPVLKKMTIRKEDDNFFIVNSPGAIYVDDNDENSQDFDEDYVEKSARRTPRAATKRVEPRTPSSAKRKLIVDGATPKRLSLRRNMLTPSMKERTLPVLKAATPLQEARRRLHVSAVPKSLPCREEEFNNIFSFLRSKILDESSGCMYISGVPGTGKTATVNETVRGLRKLVELGEIDDFKFVSVNGMKLSEPRQAYVQILKQLEDKSLTWEQAQRALEKKFKGKSDRKMTLLLVDELDMLCTKRQDVVYNLLDWPANVNARLVVVTIANTMDLPEKILKKRVNSRLGMTRLTFEPYNFLQLQQIVLSRLKTLNSFEPEAVEFIARKVASVSGDARRALDICRRATEIAEIRGREVVAMKDVREGIAEMISNPKIQAIRNCRKFELLFLRAVTNEILLSGVEETRFDRVHTQFENICKLEGMKVPNVTIALGICARLGASRLLVTEHSRADIYQKILLNVTPDDVQFATKEDFSD